MPISGAPHVQTLRARGSDGCNAHLGGAEIITGSFGGIGQPNDSPLK